MMQSYTVTIARERLDRIAKKLYATERGGTVPLLLSANPGLASLGPYLPAGTRLNVPAKPAPTSTSVTPRPWE